MINTSTPSIIPRTVDNRSICADWSPSFAKPRSFAHQAPSKVVDVTASTTASEGTAENFGVDGGSGCDDKSVEGTGDVAFADSALRRILRNACAFRIVSRRSVCAGGGT